MVVVGVNRAQQVLKFISLTSQKIVTYRTFSGNYEINHDRKKIGSGANKKRVKTSSSSKPQLVQSFSDSLDMSVRTFGLTAKRFLFSWFPAVSELILKIHLLAEQSI